jgi:hypothetical protein
VPPGAGLREPRFRAGTTSRAGYHARLGGHGSVLRLQRSRKAGKAVTKTPTRPWLRSTPTPGLAPITVYYAPPITTINGGSWAPMTAFGVAPQGRTPLPRDTSTWDAAGHVKNRSSDGLFHASRAVAMLHPHSAASRLSARIGVSLPVRAGKSRRSARGVRHRGRQGVPSAAEMTSPPGRGLSIPSVSHSRPIFTSCRDFDSETAIGDSVARRVRPETAGMGPVPAMECILTPNCGSLCWGPVDFAHFGNPTAISFRLAAAYNDRAWRAATHLTATLQRICRMTSGPPINY